MKKKFFKKVATVMVATVLGAMTVGSTVALAADSNGNVQEEKIDQLLACDDKVQVNSNEEKELLSAFEKKTVCKEEKITRYTIDVKDFKFEGTDAYISKLTATKSVYVGEVLNSNSKKEKVNYEVKEKDANGHPTSFEVSFKSKSEFITAGFFNVEIVVGGACKEISDVEVKGSPIENGTQNQAQNTAQNATSNEASKNTTQNATQNAAKNGAQNATQDTSKNTAQNQTAAPTQKPSATPSQQPTKNNDKTPKTADEMSTGLVIAMTIAGISLLTLASVYVYRRRNTL